MLLHKKFSNSSEFYYLEPGLYSSITNFVEAMNTLFQEKHNHSESCITVEVSRRMQKVDFYLANEGSGLAFFSTDLRHIFGSNVGKEIGVMLRVKKPLSPQFADVIVCIHFFMIYTDLIEYNTIYTETRCCVAFFLFQSSRLDTS